MPMHFPKNPSLKPIQASQILYVPNPIVKCNLACNNTKHTAIQYILKNSRAHNMDTKNQQRSVGELTNHHLLSGKAET